MVAAQWGEELRATPAHVEIAALASMSYSGVDRARNLALQAAISQSADWLWMMDAGVWAIWPMPGRPPTAHDPPRSVLWEMLAVAHATGAAMVGLVARVRRDGYQLNVSEDHGMGVWEVDHVGTGQCLVSVPAVRRMLEAEGRAGRVLPPFLRTLDPSDGYTIRLGGDYGICRRLRAAGELVYAHGRYPTAHADPVRGVLFYDPESRPSAADAER